MTARAKTENRNWKIEIAGGLQKLWQGLREWSGDAAYERYSVCPARARDGRVLSREEFYVEQLQRRYSRVSRCC
jgi:uncharacterized short protein YbdD (DUF466 family)